MSILSTLREELGKVFSHQLQDLLWNREIFWQLNEAWERNKVQNTAADLQWFIWQGYLAFTGTAIRRMVDQDSRAHSLRNFLVRMKQPEAVSFFSRQKYVALYPAHFPADIPHRDFDLITNGSPELTPDVIDGDIKTIVNATEPIADLVNTVIAHTDRKPKSATFKQMNDAIDTLRQVFDRYAMLIGAPRISEREFDTMVDVRNDIRKIWP